MNEWTVTLVVWIYLRFILPRMQPLKFLYCIFPVKLFWLCSSQMWVMYVCAALCLHWELFFPPLINIKSTSQISQSKFFPLFSSLEGKSVSQQKQIVSVVWCQNTPITNTTCTTLWVFHPDFVTYPHFLTSGSIVVTSTWLLDFF